MREHKNFWDRNAGLYDCFMRKDRIVYEKMYELICPVVKDKTVLELATGTGLIAKHIVKATAHIEATDASPEMITCLLYTSGGIWDWNSGSIFRLIIRTLLYLSCCAGSSSRKKDATFCFAVFSLSSSSLASLYCS